MLVTVNSEGEDREMRERGESGREGAGLRYCLGERGELFLGRKQRATPWRDWSQLGFSSHYIYSALDIGPRNSSGLGQNFAASVNRVTEVVLLHCPPRLMLNRGGCWAGCPTTNNRGGQPAQSPRRPFFKRLG